MHELERDALQGGEEGASSWWGSGGPDAAGRQEGFGTGGGDGLLSLGIVPCSLTLAGAAVVGGRQRVLSGGPAQRVSVAERRARTRVVWKRLATAVHCLLDASHHQFQQRVHGAPHVVSRGGARLEVREAVLGGLGPRSLLGHGAPFFQVRLVSAQHHVRVLAVRVRAQLLEPRTDAEKGLFASEVEEHEEAHGIPKEGRGQAAELLLASRVPQL